MVNYRRLRVPGATYFFTVTLRDRRSDLLVAHADRLRDAFRHVRKERPFAVEAIVVLPDHLHAVWRLPPDDADYSGRWRWIKARFTRELVRGGIPLRRDRRGEYHLWQRRFWEHLIRDDGDFARHANYIHYNPVKHGLVTNPFDWRLSSIHAHARTGIIAADDGASDRDGEFGER